MECMQWAYEPFDLSIEPLVICANRAHTCRLGIIPIAGANMKDLQKFPDKYYSVLASGLSQDCRIYE